MVIGSLLLSNGFYLWVLRPLLTPNDRLSLVGAAVLLMLCIFLWFKRHGSMLEIMRTRYGVMIIAFFLCIHFSTFIFGGLIEQRQNIFHAALVVSRIYAGLLVFFVLAIYCNTDRLFNLLHKFVLMVGIVWIMFLFLAYFAPDFCSSIINSPSHGYRTRLSSIYFKPPVGAQIAILYTCFYAVINFTKVPRIQNSFCLLIYLFGVFDIFFVCIMRRLSVFIIVAPLLFFIGHFNLPKKMLLLFCLCIAFFSALTIFPALKEQSTWIFQSIISEAESSHNTSVNARIRTFKYYYPELARTAYLGYGYYSPDKVSQRSRLAHGQAIGLYEGDMGIVMPLLMYGIQGLLWTALMYYILFSDLIRSKCLPPQHQMIRNTLLILLLWSVFSLNTFVWGYHGPFWWGVMIFMGYYISKKSNLVKTETKSYSHVKTFITNKCN